MKVVVVAVGRVKERGLRAAVDDYASRIKHYVGFEEIEIDDGPPDKVAAAVKKAAKAATLVPLDASGTECSSRAFADRLSRWGSQGKGDVAFAIGGKEGLSKALLAEAPYVLSLSQMTLPHRLARLFLVEQIYRGMTLLRGEPYGM
ncbi:MAG: 23S rRNA (pseudouridine(1915)-N(3))-methyltransferase RlmH [Polyangiaceae bacterium]|nr:23S rRNA (pseudouridine(1915)-N(3))-methyltransferase RlmH [Polyangiaceae bacterium]